MSTLLTPKAFDPDRAESVFNEAVDLAILSDNFRLRLQQKLEQLAETRPSGRRPVQKHKEMIVKTTVEMVQNYHRAVRGIGWRQKVTVTGAIREAARILGITDVQAKERYYK